VGVVPLGLHVPRQGLLRHHEAVLQLTDRVHEGVRRSSVFKGSSEDSYRGQVTEGAGLFYLKRLSRILLDSEEGSHLAGH